MSLYALILSMIPMSDRNTRDKYLCFLLLKRGQYNLDVMGEKDNI